jgi:aminopeptidase N
VPSSSTSTSTTSTTVVAPVAAQPATPTCPAIPARAEPSPDRPRYRLRVDVRPGENLVDGDLTVRFTPTTATDRLVFRLWPGRRLTTEGVTVDGHGVTAERTNDTTLVVPLGRTTTDTLRATMHWVLTLPGAEPDRIARIGDTVRLGSFFPILGWDGGGWTYEPPTSNFAEASTAPTADFEVEVTTPPGLTALVSGDGHAVAMRDVGIAVGRFRVVDGAAGPVHVRVAVENGLPDDPRSYLPTIVGALDDFSRRFGPYPWPTYTMVVTPALKGGIEYPGLVHQGPSTQGRSTPHEVGHQWFYGLVGDDQGRDPWLDEGLATWAEARFRGNLDQFRAVDIPPDAAGRTGAPMTYWEGRSSYYRGVYVQGAQALAALGPPDLVDCALRLYVARNAYRVARPSDLLDSLRAVFPDAAGVLARYGASAGP